MAPPDPGPLPPADLVSRELPIEIIDKGTRLVRIHRSELDPIFFGSSGGNRFDDPTRQYGVCYLARTIEGAFAETCLRSVGARFVALTFLEARSFCEIEVTAPLRLVSVHGPGLAQIGATGIVTSGPHSVAQQWSSVIHDHPAGADGITYRSNHDNGELCVAMFERARDRLAAIGSTPMLSNRARLGELLARYKVGLG
ncbi:RES family NAD+ phosphorylase [Rhizobium sp. YS-1r]|uniref:RES family NAD+ phosphorylase n=1 Tax=Rhizobium sp. YS-1r TaxID=1532558 RepID=UPI00068DCF0A|nr:RES family NAD+ phosphorylase [Rhizobium sp. YS-1r]